MQKVLISCFITLFFIFSLTGCAQIKDKNASNNSNLSENNVIRKSNTNYSLSKLKNNQTPNLKNTINAKLDDGEEFIRTFNILKTAANKNDKETISDYINYPLIVYINGTNTKISNKIEFINHYDDIFNSKIKNTLKNQDINNLKITPNGIIVGNGEIYLNLINNGKHEYGICTINNK